MHCAAASRSHRGNITIVAPAYNGPFMPPCMPVTWNIGNTDRCVLSGDPENQTLQPTRVLMTLRCVCMQPFGLPVVPDVYGITQRSSGPAVRGPGVRRRSSTVLQAVTPGRSIDCFGAATNSGGVIDGGRFR